MIAAPTTLAVHGVIKRASRSANTALKLSLETVVEVGTPTVVAGLHRVAKGIAPIPAHRERPFWMRFSTHHFANDFSVRIKDIDGYFHLIFRHDEFDGHSDHRGPGYHASLGLGYHLRHSRAHPLAR